MYHPFLSSTWRVTIETRNLYIRKYLGKGGYSLRLIYGNYLLGKKGLIFMSYVSVLKGCIKRPRLIPISCVKRGR